MINKCSSYPAEVIPGSDILIICSPAQTKTQILEEIKPYIEPNTLVGTIFGQGGFDLQCKYALGDDVERKNLTIFASQYVPFICRVSEYGQECQIIGPKKHIYCAAYPVEKVHQVCQTMTYIFTIPAIVVPNFLNIALSPANQIIHPGRMYGYLKNWDGKSTWNKESMPKLYEDMDQESAKEIQGLSDEIQAIKSKLADLCPSVKMDQVIPIGQRITSMYGKQVGDTSSLHKIFSTNKGYAGINFPTVPVQGGKADEVTIDIKGRLFYEDMPFGCVIIKEIGNIVGVQTPNVDKIIQWH
jgi:hypothetical protein